MTADLEAIAARLNAATPGPWEIDRYPHGGGRIAIGMSISNSRHLEYHRELIADYEGTHATLYNVGDRELLFHAPADIAALIADLRAAREREQRVRELASGEAIRAHALGRDERAWLDVLAILDATRALDGEGT